MIGSQRRQKSDGRVTVTRRQRRPEGDGSRSGVALSDAVGKFRHDQLNGLGAALYHRF